jgi:hypothetical protein
VLSATGGVGTAAIQLGRLAGADVSATVRAEHLRETVATLGAEVHPLIMAAIETVNVIIARLIENWIIRPPVAWASDARVCPVFIEAPNFEE